MKRPKSDITLQNWAALATFGWLATTLAVVGEVRPNSLFSEGMVLQQGREVPVWGTAADGERVTVRCQGQTVETTARQGRWQVSFKPLKAGGPFTMIFSGENTITFTNVLVGEVWLCSGQSNMAFPLSRAHNATEAIAASADPQLRLYTVPRKAADEPQTDAPGKWQASRPDTAATFSAVAYFFGRDLRKALAVPVGLIHSSVGGTPAEAWTSRGTLEQDPELKEILERHAEAVKKFDPERAQAAHKKAVEKHKAAVKQARAEGRPVPTAPRAPENPLTGLKRPSGLYNGMIAPLEPYAIAGAIWYQGEANSGRAAQYQKLFPAMIRDWRRAWKTELPFLFVQIAPHQNMTPEVREAQLLTWQRVPKTAMAVTADVGDRTDIHPTRKEPVGHRLALAALAVAYGQKLTYSGPVYESMRVQGNKAILRFEHVGGGLVAGSGPLRGFTIAGENGEFVGAQAKIDGANVVVWSSSVEKPAAVRYGWANTPDANLFNAEGLPATPFRTNP